MSVSRWAKERAKRILRRTFEVGQRAGVDILPRHFYSGIPDIARLRSTRSWRAPRSMLGVSGTDITEQLGELSRWCEAAESGCKDAGIFSRACEQNGDIGFGQIEAQALYGFVRCNRPSRIIQIGCGVSTAVILEACDDAELESDIVCLDPYPTDYLVRLAAAGRVNLRREPAEETPLDVFQQLAAGDLLFVDSTHTVGPGSEVNRVVLEILPMLPRGVWVHFHDIVFPYDYNCDLLDGALFFWNESALLLAFLTMNEHYRLSVCMSMLHHAAAGAMRTHFPNYSPCPNSDGLRAGEGHFPTSTYLKA